VEHARHLYGQHPPIVGNADTHRVASAANVEYDARSLERFDQVTQ
jgi:hypothetical protein